MEITYTQPDDTSNEYHGQLKISARSTTDQEICYAIVNLIGNYKDEEYWTMTHYSVKRISGTYCRTDDLDQNITDDECKLSNDASLINRAKAKANTITIRMSDNTPNYCLCAGQSFSPKGNIDEKIFTEWNKTQLKSIKRVILRDEDCTQYAHGATHESIFTFEICDNQFNTKSNILNIQQWKLIAYSSSNISNDSDNLSLINEPIVDGVKSTESSPEKQAQFYATNIKLIDDKNMRIQNRNIQQLSIEWCNAESDEVTEENADSCIINYGIMKENSLEPERVLTFAFAKI